MLYKYITHYLCFSVWGGLCVPVNVNFNVSVCVCSGVMCHKWKIFNAAVVMHCIFFYKRTQTLNGCVFHIWGSHTWVQWSVWSVWFVWQLLSDLKQHRKFSNVGEADHTIYYGHNHFIMWLCLFILRHWQHPVNKMIFICYRAALTDLNPASNTNELINPDEQ